MKVRKFPWRRILSISAIFIIIGVSAVASAGGFDANPVWADVISKVISSWLATVIVMFLAYSDQKLAVYDNPDHVFHTKTGTLNDEVDGIVERGLMFAFRQYSHKMFEEKREQFIHRVLRDVGLGDPRILLISNDEIGSLVKTPYKGEINGKLMYHDTISPKQLKVIHRVKAGKFKYEELGSDYFITVENAKGNDAYKYHTEIKKWRAENMTKRVIIKMSFILIYSILFALLKEPDPDKMWVFWMTLASYAAGGLGGFLSGTNMAKTDIRSILGEVDFKISMLVSFSSDYRSGAFVPQSVDDIIKKKLDDINKEKDEEDEVESEEYDYVEISTPVIIDENNNLLTKSSIDVAKDE